MVNSLLDFSRMEAGRVRASYAPVDLGAFSADIASNFRSAIERAGLRLRIDARAFAGAGLRRPGDVGEDPAQPALERVQVHAGRRDRPVGRGLSGRPERDRQVSDTGVGIPAEELPRLFERFHRIEGQRGRSIEGSGIGLALVSDLVKLHGGEIAVESAPGRGTTFTVSAAARPRSFAGEPSPHRSAGGAPIIHRARISRRGVALDVGRD